MVPPTAIRSVYVGALLFLGCGGSVHSELDVSPPATDAGDEDVFVEAGDPEASTPIEDAGTSDVRDVYVEPSCPDVEPKPPIVQCDPFATPTGCLPGEACRPFVEYPRHECDTERYGAVCIPAGTGKQGDPCAGGDGCADGFVCVISGAGVQCVKLCELDKHGACENGLVCEPIDVPGFGGCL